MWRTEAPQSAPQAVNRPWGRTRIRSLTEMPATRWQPCSSVVDTLAGNRAVDPRDGTLPDFSNDLDSAHLDDPTWFPYGDLDSQTILEQAVLELVRYRCGKYDDPSASISPSPVAPTSFWPTTPSSATTASPTAFLALSTPPPPPLLSPLPPMAKSLSTTSPPKRQWPS